MCSCSDGSTQTVDEILESAKSESLANDETDAENEERIEQI